MYDFASRAWGHVTIGTQNLFSSELHALGGATSASSAVWPSANRALYIPCYIFENVVIKQMAALSGATASGNLDMAVYNEGLGRIIASPAGAIAQTGTNTPQVFDVTDTALVPGRYWIGLVHSNTTGTYRRWTNAASMANLGKCLGMAQETLGSTAMGATMTPVANADSYVPQVALYTESVAW